ncbi:MAG: PQQ-binding-like beta-propeller repeat protein [Deltaproteobacteria bacterium]|nr:PQQ-binding-like beta-propeller repeat protein [Deltaproteobacteria bacterium]
MARRLVGIAALAVAALLVAGCAETRKSMAGLCPAQRSSPGSAAGAEHVYSIDWWARADQTFALPYRPVEPGEPEVDPRTDHVFVGTADGKVRAFNSQGRFLWEHAVESAFDAGPTLADGRLYVAASKGQLLALDAASGKVIWEYASAEEIVTKPVVTEGLVIVMSSADTVFAVDQAKGDWRWQYRRDQPSDFTVRGAGRPVVFEGRVFAGFADGWAVALDSKDGVLQWAKDLGGGKPFADVDAGPVMDEEGRVFFASFATGLFALEAGTGKLIWTAPRAGISALAMGEGGKRLFAGGNGFISAFDGRSGQVGWSERLGTDQFVSGMAVASGLVLASTGSGPLMFFDGGTGRLRQSFDPGRGVWARPHVHGAQACVLSNRGVVYQMAIEARGRP